MGDKIRENEEGEIEVYDGETNKKIGTQSRKKDHIRKTRKTKIKTTTVVKERIRILTPKLKNAILNLALEGKTVTRIASEIGWPRKVLYEWLRAHHEFRKEFEASKKIAAYNYEDKMEELVEKTQKKSHVIVNKFKFDSYKQLAEIANPERYGKKTTVEGNPDKPIKIIFDTGITRTPVEDKTKKKEVKDVVVDVTNVDKDSN